MSDLLKIGALWRKMSAAGKVFYSGQFDVAKVQEAVGRGENHLLLFPVKLPKKSEKGPDVELFIAPDKPRS